MNKQKYIEKIIDLTDPAKNIIYDMSVAAAKEILSKGCTEEVSKIDGQFALVAVSGTTVRMARTIGRPIRYFIAKRADGPQLVVADRIDEIYNFLKREGLDGQFHPSYTRMIPAHYITEIALVGCPDPNPTYHRFFNPVLNCLDPEVPRIGRLYMQTLYEEIVKWLRNRATDGPIGVCFSGGIDSGSVFLLTYYAFLQLGLNLSRLKAFTLSIDGGGNDLAQARQFLDNAGLSLFLESIEVSREDIDWREAITITEDFKPLDSQAATMTLVLYRGIRQRYPEWKFLIDGEGGDENLKDYPIEENPELTIRSVLNNRMLYQDGWGVDSVKHSLTYSGGLSRGYTRTYAPSCTLGFETFSPYTLPAVIEVAEGIPFVDLTGWDHKKLYELKGNVVSSGLRSITGIDMPVFPKRRFQHGVAPLDVIENSFPELPNEYRRTFNATYE